MCTSDMTGDIRISLAERTLSQRDQIMRENIKHHANMRLI